MRLRMADPTEKMPTSRAPSSRGRTGGRVVALTGAASFLGRNLVGLLEEDPATDRIVTIDVKWPDTAGPKTRNFEIDLTTPSSEDRVAEVLASEGVDTLVHLCFLSSPTHATAWAHELESVGTMHLLNAARHVSLRKLVQWSQTLLYGAHPTNPNFLTERHALRADADEPFFGDKLGAEREIAAFAAKSKGTVVTVLRTAPMLGPTVQNWVTRYLSLRVVPTLLGFDPLWQFVHEVDALAAFKLAIDRDHPGTFNIVGDGVLPLSTILHLAGRTPMPLLHPLASSLVGALWATQVSAFPPSFLRYLRYLCVADGDRAARVLSFRPAYTAREALLDYNNAQRLRDARLLHEGSGGARPRVERSPA
jgi:UDP-glucose 4-epimerase